MKTKKCFKCNKEKPLSGFYKHSEMKDGRVNKCKECNKKDVSDNYRKNIEHYKDYEKKRSTLPHRVKARYDYSQTEEGKLAGKNGRKRYIEKNPIKIGATCIVNNAVRSGKIVKPEHCSVCECKPKRIHGHHDDYAQPLIVRWLCPKCHTSWHKENGEGDNG